MASSDSGFGVSLHYHSGRTKKINNSVYVVPGTLFALIGMPLTTFISRRQLDSVTITFSLTTPRYSHDSATLVPCLDSFSRIFCLHRNFPRLSLCHLTVSGVHSSRQGRQRRSSRRSSARLLLPTQREHPMPMGGTWIGSLCAVGWTHHLSFLVFYPVVSIITGWCTRESPNQREHVSVGGDMFSTNSHSRFVLQVLAG